MCAKELSTKDIDCEVGRRIRKARLMSEMTQEKLAAALGLTFQQIQKYEKGVNRVTAGRVHKISKILGVPISFFFEGLDELDTPPEREGLDTQSNLILLDSSETQRVARALQSLPIKEIRPKIVELIEVISRWAGSRQ